MSRFPISEARKAQIAQNARMDAALPGFWQARFEEYDSLIAANPEKGAPHNHKGIDTAQLMSDCRPCAEKRIRWMIRQPQSYLRATGERFAKLYKIEGEV